jgi:hypothetical protein
MIFEDKSLITLFGLIVLLILFLNMSSEGFQNATDNKITIKNRDSNSNIPPLIKKPLGNFTSQLTDLYYDAKEEKLHGTHKDKYGDNVYVDYDIALNHCTVLDYNIRKEEFVCLSSV